MVVAKIAQHERLKARRRFGLQFDLNRRMPRQCLQVPNLALAFPCCRGSCVAPMLAGNNNAPAAPYGSLHEFWSLRPVERG